MFARAESVPRGVSGVQNDEKKRSVLGVLRSVVRGVCEREEALCCLRGSIVGSEKSACKKKSREMLKSDKCPERVRESERERQRISNERDFSESWLGFV